MLSKDVLKEVVLAQQKDLELPFGVTREKQVKPLKKFALIITGLRRSGKSTLLRQYFSNKKPIYYLHFEDLRLSSFESSDFTKLNVVFEEVLGNDGVYFLDEVQNINSWEIYVRSLVDSGKEVYVTGSNSSLMSKELGTRLTGRHISEELYPFNFSEFCLAKKKKESLKLFDDYLVSGGLPEYVLQQDVRILESLVKDIIYKDVLVRHRIREEAIVERLVSYILSNIGKEISYNKIKDLMGVGSPNTIISLMDALEDAYFIFTINTFDYSLKKQLRNKRKVYCVDNGFITQTSLQFSKNLGRLLENLVFVELKRRGYEIFFHKEKYECDFIIKKNNLSAIQVCYELNLDNQQRELNGLVEGMKKIKATEGIIITRHQDDFFEIDDMKIKVVSIMDWLKEFE
ncbi:ATP-binding protein [Candidatus Woesearchaeota archaeon]|nr:ATP-binding protein [Candidatus Woesearchaeota archaeon]